MTDTYRLLITGSRDWPDEGHVEGALEARSEHPGRQPSLSGLLELVRSRRSDDP